jgi:protein-disulfide isomerase
VLGAADNPVPPVGPTDMVLGRPDAPVTLIEYGSLTCPHCAAFEQTYFPQIKAEWIDTGKIRFIFRDYPRDRDDLTAFQFVHCSGDQRFWAFLDSLYAGQEAWTTAPDLPAEFVRLGRFGGLSEAQTRACLADDALAAASAVSRKDAEAAGVDATPSFFINGRKAALGSMADLERALGEATAKP